MVSLAPYVLKRPWLTKMLTPAANWYASAAGYRQLGLRYEPNLLKLFARMSAMVMEEGMIYGMERGGNFLKRELLV